MSSSPGLEAGNGLIDLLGRGFLESRKLDVADAFGGFDDLGASDALDIDMATNQPDLAAITVALEDLQVDARAFRPLKSIGGLIQAKPLDDWPAISTIRSPVTIPASQAGPPRITPTKRNPCGSS